MKWLIGKENTISSLWKWHPMVWLVAIHLLITVIKIMVVNWGNFNLQSEEAQYWYWSKHLQLSYYSKPPLIAYINWLSTSLLGDSEIGIRINAIIIGLLIAITTYILSKELFGSHKKAALASLIAYIMPYHLIPSLFFSTDTPLTLFWLLSLLFFWRALKTQKIKHWVLTGIFVGLGILSKYAMLFILPALLLYMLKIKPDQIKTLKIWIPVTLAIIISLPIIVWNFQQNWVGFYHIYHLSGMPNKSLGISKIIFNILKYTGGQIALISPFFIPTFFKGGKALKFIPNLSKQTTLKKKHSSNEEIETLTPQICYILFPPIMVFLIFLIISAIRPSGANINWTLFAYSPLPILLSHWAIKYNHIKIIGRSSLFSIVIIILLFNLKALDNINIGQIWPPRYDPVKNISGWENLAATVDQATTHIPSDSLFIFSDNYHIASELNFYMDNGLQAYCINIGRRMNQYDLWPGVEQFEGKKFYGIYVSFNAITEKISNSFHSNIKHINCPTIYRNTKINNFNIYVLKDFRGIPKTTKPISY